MNMRDMFLIICVALGTSWAIEYFMGSKKAAVQEEEERSGQSFMAPKARQEFKPLNTEIDFIDVRRSEPAVTTTVETAHALYDFSTDGGSLDRLRFKRQLQDTQGTIATIFPTTDSERENRCFLVALADKTPFFYKLVDRIDRDSSVDVIYEAETPEARIRKVFTVYNDSYKIDLTLSVAAKKEGLPLEPRIVFPAPLIPDILSRDVRSVIVNNERGSVTKISRASVDSSKGWFAPTIFGADDRYFVHAMVNDAQHFSKRAYSKVVGSTDLLAILEGPAVDTEQTWTISFYCGPKEVEAMQVVDSRLEQTFDYSWILAPIAKFLLALLVYFKGYLGNYGFAIIILTLVVRILLLPFALRSTRDMNEGMRKSAEMRRKLDYLKQRYKDDPDQFNREQEELIRKHGLPGLGGCLPLLLQLPVFFALSNMISNSIQLYKAPFIGWITDLSATDPYYVLPALVGGSMFLQSLVSSDSKQRIQMVVLALMLAVFSSYWSAGLCLYLLISTLLGVFQTGVQKRLGWA